MGDNVTTFSRETAETFLIDAFLASNVSEANAQSVAKALVAAEIDGQKGHGFSRVAAYAAQAKSGKVNGHADVVITKRAPAVLDVDAANGFAFPAIDRAIDALSDLAAETGIAAAGIRRSHHCGQLGAHVERLAERGCLAIMVGNSPKAMAPWGGTAPLFGTNPIAFAAPRRDNVPLVVDLSLSKVARGKIMAAAKAGEDIPEGWALDADGNPTTNADAALAGSMIPLGDAKGAALALMVEILSATVTGANYSFDAASFFDASGDPPGVGQYLLAIDSKRGAAESFADRIEILLEIVLDQDGTRLPGEKRLKGRQACFDNGFTVPKPLVDEIKNLFG